MCSNDNDYRDEWKDSQHTRIRGHGQAKLSLHSLEFYARNRPITTSLALCSAEKLNLSRKIIWLSRVNKVIIVSKIHDFGHFIFPIIEMFAFHLEVKLLIDEQQAKQSHGIIR